MADPIRHLRSKCHWVHYYFIKGEQRGRTLSYASSNFKGQFNKAPAFILLHNDTAVAMLKDTKDASEWVIDNTAPDMQIHGIKSAYSDDVPFDEFYLIAPIDNTVSLSKDSDGNLGVDIPLDMRPSDAVRKGDFRVQNGHVLWNDGNGWRPYQSLDGAEPIEAEFVLSMLMHQLRRAAERATSPVERWVYEDRQTLLAQELDIRKAAGKDSPVHAFELGDSEAVVEWATKRLWDLSDPDTIKSSATQDMIGDAFGIPPELLERPRCSKCGKPIHPGQECATHDVGSFHISRELLKDQPNFVSLLDDQMRKAIREEEWRALYEQRVIDPNAGP